MDMAAFSNMAVVKFDDILNQIKNSSLNFQMKVSPFTAVIHLKKSITKDKSGNFLLQNTNKRMDDLKSEKFEVEKEVANLKRSYLEITDSIAEIEKKLFTLNGHQKNSKENVQQAVLNNVHKTRA